MTFQILLTMIFLHIVDDFILQGKLGDMKQKQWWINHPQYNIKYKNDWIIALILHSFSWTFMIMLPLMYNHYIGLEFIIVFIINMIVHAITDHCKANKLEINLIQDQSIHLTQILITFLVFLFFRG